MKFKLLIIIFITSFCVYSQNNVGLILNSNDVYSGFTLFSINTKTFLINNCGEVINEWNTNYLPGNAVYLLEDGNLLRAGKTDTNDINFGGVGGKIELFNWEGTLLWSIDYDTPNYRQHHDIYPMPNGNILILAATVMEQDEAVQNGRDPSLINNQKLYNEQIIEIEPVGANSYNTIWEWNVKDHLIQDFDVSKSNFGNVGLNPQLLNINFLNNQPISSNWLHFNSIQYNELLDQIVISSRTLSEIYIIDHSTTTAQAASNIGGIYNKGGDFLYRWGNPQAYNQGTENDRKLYGQHYPHWIPNGFNDENKIILYNNGNGRTPSFSEVFILNPPITNGDYDYTANTAYLPLNPDYIYTNSDDFYSSILSSAQRLSNGNTLICEGRSGEVFEIDSNENIVWKYIVPVNNATGAIIQPTDALPFNNLTFRAIKYSMNYPAFIGRDLTPSPPIEGTSITNNCGSLSVSESELSNLSIRLFPNPVKGVLNIEYKETIETIEIYNLLGKKVKSLSNNSKSINIQDLSSGMYLLKIYSGNRTISRKIVKY